MPDNSRRTCHPHQLTRCARIIALAAATLVWSWQISAQSPPQAEITQVTDKLYQFADGDDAGAFLYTDSGIALIDPLQPSTARWLRDEINSRFGQPVKFIVYSSHQAHRTGGAEEFPEATIIAHEQAVESLQTGTARLPSIVFSDTLTIRLGGQEMVLHHAGPSVTNDTLVAHFPAENALYAGDLVAINRVPQLPADGLASVSASHWATAVDKMNRTDFVYLLTSHKGIGIQEDGRKHGQFLRELAYRVKRALQRGDSADAIRQSVTMDNYRHWAGHDNTEQLVESFLRSLQAEQNQ